MQSLKLLDLSHNHLETFQLMQGTPLTPSYIVKGKFLNLTGGTIAGNLIPIATVMINVVVDVMIIYP